LSANLSINPLDFGIILRREVTLFSMIVGGGNGSTSKFSNIDLEGVKGLAATLSFDLNVMGLSIPAKKEKLQ